MHARQKIPHERYAEAVLAELALRAPLFPGRRAISLYFGGGTPGLWRHECVGQIVAGVRAAFGLADEAEVTVEANPDDLPPEQLLGLRRAGVSRLSLGVQSLEPKHLASLGRLHGAGEAARAVENARQAGFRSLSVDLMFALPGQTMGELDRDLDGILGFQPDHVSIYNLTVEPRTAFGALKRQGLLQLPDDGLAAEMYERIDRRLVREGFGHYEISSWARPGSRAVHNTLYWTGGEYLGLGCSASSFRLVPGDGAPRGERWSNLRSVDQWLPAVGRGGEEAIGERETLSAEALEREAVWLGLRFLDGIDRADHARRHGVDPLVRHAEELRRLEAEGLVELQPAPAARLRLTPRGVLFADEVGARFL